MNTQPIVTAAGENFFRHGPEENQHLFQVNAGAPLVDVLNTIACLIDTIQVSLDQISSADVTDVGQCSKMTWGVQRHLDSAHALIQSLLTTAARSQLE